MRRTLRSVLAAMAVYISITGLVTFGNFILEESIQTAMFGTWPAQDAKDWITAKAGLNTIIASTRTLYLINTYLGWIQPLAWFSYGAYHDAAQVYIDGLRSKIFANAPELFVGETIPVTFIAAQVQGPPWICTNHNIKVLSKTPRAPLQPFRIIGRISAVGELITITQVD